MVAPGVEIITTSTMDGPIYGMYNMTSKVFRT